MHRTPPAAPKARHVLGSLIIVGLGVGTPARAADLEGFGGHWVTQDQSIVEVKSCPDARSLCAYLVQAREYGLDDRNPDPELRKRPICGLPILELKRFSDGVWRDGRVYDPEAGKTYKAALRMREGKLFLRAFIGTEVFGETETWTRAVDFTTPCKP